ncbi:hypothetical protein PIROE2DRAFT_11342 [Piromyces sp. E2]|nr:hypothetical protein PIROE2DRAFT_11342 [Piromyces sp. E2]|eukprot:OUM62384.1 hypothetical protein PIROE2DRAFT_11342 [Piromyces sp. E2]
MDKADHSIHLVREAEINENESGNLIYNQIYEDLEIKINQDNSYDEKFHSNRIDSLHKDTFYNTDSHRTGSPINNPSKRPHTENNHLSINSINSDYAIPFNYNQAISRKNKQNWIKAINDELHNLYSNNIMTFFKARLVASGFIQVFGIDFDLTYYKESAEGTDYKKTTQIKKTQNNTQNKKN